jgi:shikimate kinase
MLIFEVKLINNMGQKPTKKLVFLTGYMGSGKSTIGLALSKQLSVLFIDLDIEIEGIEKMSISEIFEKKGENYFRAKESNLIKNVIQHSNAAVIALGGGSISDTENLNMILKDGLLIYLEASVSTIVKRLKEEAAKRPLIAQFKSDVSLKDFIQSHLSSRLKNYREADYTINTDIKNRDQIISELIAVINSNKNEQLL